jgi:hypothetical protein
MKKTVRFSEAIVRAAEIIDQQKIPVQWNPLLLRDVYGRLRVALNVNREEHGEEIGRLQAAMESLGAFAGEPKVLCQADVFDPNTIFKDPSILSFQVHNSDALIRLLDRQVTGQDWLLTPESKNDSDGKNVTRLVFFGLKGGVGRSTALAILAYHLAKAGKRVLSIDLDLESPGLSGLLMPPDRLADFGIVDWLVEDAVGQSDDLPRRMISESPLSANLRQQVHVAAATGRGDPYYLDKLSRAYADVPGKNGPQRFSDRIKRLIELLAIQEKPDVILIDSRAGLHDLAAVSIVGLASTAFLFGSDAAQSWQGYKLLFAHWQSRPAIARFVREKLKMVSGLFPDREQASRAQSFLERSHALFTETLYDEIGPGDAAASEDLFNFTMGDISAPHYPLRIKWDNRFQEFDPLEIPKGLFSEDEVRASFGDFLDGAVQLISEAAE